MTGNVWIAGGGVICGIGQDLAQCLGAFEKMQPGMATMQHLQSVHAQTFPVVEVKAGNEELAQRAGLPAHLSRTALLSLIAAREAWESAGLGDIAQYRAGFVSANTVGGMDKTEHFFEAFVEDNSKGRLREVVHHECGSITELVADAMGIRHHVSTISTACSSGANALMYGARMISNDLLDVVIAGGTDALTRFTLNGFNTLMILDQQKCRPFDDTRTGLNLGEGAGYVALVSDRLAEKIKPWCRLSGFANANDAYHQTASSPEGTGNYLAMQGALNMSGLQPGDIDYINLHGTASQKNDEVEAKIVADLFPTTTCASSTKGWTGHTLGAAGIVESVIALIALESGELPGTLNSRTPDAACGPQIRFEPARADIRYAMNNSFGFGGNNCSLVFARA